MKKAKLMLLIAATIFQLSLLAQTPQKFSYQAVVKNASNNLVTNHAVGLKLSILNASGTVVYAETQTPVTNANGLISVEVGAGTVVSGTMAGIDWSTSTYSLKSEIDPTGGTSYSITGTSSLLSVPYALHAKTVDNAFSGSYTDLTNKPTLATVAISGSYADLTNKPSIPSGTVTSVTGTSPISVATGTSTPAISLGTVPVANGGTGATNLTGYVKGAGTSTLTAAATIPAADISGNITGNATNVSGTVAVSNGGTGTTTAPTQYGLIYASTTSAYASTAAGTSGYLLQSNGTSAPSWLSTVPVANGGTGTTTGSITGTSALTLAAGGTNQNVNITPSGTGFIVLGGNVGIGGSWNSAFKLSIADASTTASSATLNISKTGAISGDGYGVSVSISGASNGTYAMRGLASGTGVNNISVLGQSQGAATSNYGVYGVSLNGTSKNYGVYGGTSGSTGTTSMAGWFQNTSTPAITKYGTYSEATGANGTNIGGFFSATGATNNYGLIVDGGNVGIGTTSPAYKLDVFANVNATYAAQILNNSSAGSGLSVIAGGNPGNGSNKLLSLKNGGSNEKFTVLDNGYVGIGTTSPTNMLTINGSATSQANVQLQYDGVTKGYLWYDSGSDFIGVGRGSAGNSITLRTSQLNYNSAYCTGTTWVDASDARLKRDIQPMTNYGLSTVMQLKPVTYYFKADKTNHHEVGFIAQEMQKIVPEVVSGTEGDLEKGETLGLSYGNLVPVLTKAIQEQQVTIESQTQTISALHEAVKSQQVQLDELKSLLKQVLNK